MTYYNNVLCYGFERLIVGRRIINIDIIVILPLLICSGVFSNYLWRGFTIYKLMFFVLTDYSASHL